MAEDSGFPAKSIDDWSRLASAELRGKPVDDLHWATPEGIRVKPLYTAADLEGIEHAGLKLPDLMPGFPPYLRGPRATLYAHPPWAIRQYAGFSPPEATHRLYRHTTPPAPTRP